MPPLDPTMQSMPQLAAQKVRGGAPVMEPAGGAKPVMPGGAPVQRRRQMASAGLGQGSGAPVMEQPGTPPPPNLMEQRRQMDMRQKAMGAPPPRPPVMQPRPVPAPGMADRMPMGALPGPGGGPMARPPVAPPMMRPGSDMEMRAPPTGGFPGAGGMPMSKSPFMRGRIPWGGGGNAR